MAAMAVGDTALARSLREKLEVTGPELLAMLGPEGMGDGARNPRAGHLPEGAMPPDHPTLETVPRTPSDRTPGERAGVIGIALVLPVGIDHVLR